MDINIDKLQQICLDFFRLSEMGFSIWDENSNIIFSYPTVHAPFCKAVRSDKNLTLKCARSDSHGLDMVKQTKKPYIYTCHMGLTEAIVPILQDEDIVGYIMMGQIVENTGKANILRRIAESSEDDEFRTRLMDTLDKNVSSSSDRINYCINILKVMIDYMNLSYVIQKSNESVYSKAKKYISGNMSKAILPKDVCKAIGVSSNTLYKTIKSRKGMSPTEFIRKLKIDEAKRLLLGSGDAVSAVAESVGIPDVNYFIRVFKKETGMSPLKYRKTVVYGKN